MRRRHPSTRCGSRAAAALTVSALLLPAAALAQTGAIAGTVTRQNGGAPIVGAEVYVFDSQFLFVATTQTDGAGAYSATGLPAASYFLFAYVDGFLDEGYADVVCEDTACNVGSWEPVLVTGGGTTSGIDFSLLDPSANSISGLVLRSSPTAPIAGVTVRASVPAISMQYDTVTAANGSFTLEELPAGPNDLYAGQLAPWLDELHDDVPCPFFNCDPSAGDPIVVVTGTPTTGVLFVLDEGGTVDGTLTRSDTGAPVVGAEVQFFSELFGGSVVTTDASGHFDLGFGLPPGDYRFGFRGDAELRGELFQNVPLPLGRDFLDATPVTVQGTATVPVGITPPPHPIFADGCETGGTGPWSSATDLPVCAASLCQETPQEPRDPACDPCVAQICAVNGQCCDVEWDSGCVVEVWSTCGAPICF